MDLSTFLSITPLYIAILGLLFIPFTLRAGLYRAKTKIYIGTGDDPELLRRVRGQANFVETVPIALILFVAMELMGASDLWLHILGGSLVVGRIAHYIGLTQLGPPVLRVFGMIATIATILVSSVWIIVSTF
ncbi:MAG: MAPEG family protein [Cellvibrionaceae bacterium]